MKTEWHTLEKDGYYFIEYKHIQSTSFSHATVSVEIEDLNQPVADHYHSMRQVQRVIIGQTIVRDTITINITQPDGGSFSVVFTNPNTGVTWTSGAISTNIGSWDLTLALQGYFGTAWGSAIKCSRTWFDVNGNPTTT